MISVDEALQLVLQHTILLRIQEVDLLNSVGRVLAQEVLADRDFPPFHRVTMDGIAINSQTFASGKRTFQIEQTQAAGTPQIYLKDPENCIEVMTGAMLPQNTDAVIPYEVCSLQASSATVQTELVVSGQNIHTQGADGKAGEVLLTPGTKITPAMVGTLASVGLARVKVYQLPRVAICSTGDELVEVDQTPLPHQIRRSNAYMLAAALQQENIPAALFHLPDEPETMKLELTSILARHEVLLLSGAVSKGKFDFLPQVLEQLGLRQVFHKIAQKPGKPMLFGTIPDQKVVFGFPGNPVSTFVCYQLYFKPWLHQSLSLSKTAPYSAQLAQNLTFKPALTYHVPVTLSNENGVLKATPVDTTGSGDLTSLLKADALLSLPPERVQFRSGEAFPFIPF
ncbi:molybdopterin molybdotransferase MoeA [Rufibacter psychrotolerans]|uniref:molybdopterin molybdotransferase MoeA n=1 Tax=Rufibacter psychrotolerans TaxID=2812556 RepID=UPI0019672214|nr:gephyrin-like molybdotransferase Glp [Rufibacter sp. SYSU D00308]